MIAIWQRKYIFDLNEINIKISNFLYSGLIFIYISIKLRCIKFLFYSCKHIHVSSFTNQRTANIRDLFKKWIQVEWFLNLFIAAFFLLSWTPYTIYAVHQMATNTLSMGYKTVSVPGLFAKSSAMWNPIIYFLRDSEFRKMCRQRCGFYNFFFAKRRSVNLTRKDTTLQTLVSSPDRESQV